MAISIITDSTAYLSASMLQEENIQVIPLNVVFEEHQYREGVDINHGEFYQLMRSRPVFPSTSQPSVGDFLKVYRALPPGEEALVLTISSNLSGTWHSAQLAHDMLNRDDVKIHIINSQSSTIGLALQIMKVCELRRQGHNMPAILDELKRIIPQTQVFFVVDNLEYLARGGRIGPAAKYLGNILQIKPILYLREGKISIFDKVRTKHKAVKQMVDNFIPLSSQIEKLAITHVDNPQEAAALRQSLNRIYKGPIYMRETGPVIGAHVGPGTVGIAYF